MYDAVDICAVQDWEVERNTLFVCQSVDEDFYRSVYVLSTGDSVEEIDIE